VNRGGGRKLGLGQRLSPSMPARPDERTLPGPCSGTAATGSSPFPRCGHPRARSALRGAADQGSGARPRAWGAPGLAM